MGTLLRTLALVKPDAVRLGRALDIRQRAELEGFTVLAQERIQLTRNRAVAFYADHVGKSFFPELVEYMTSGPVYAYVLARVDAIRAWRQLILRALFGLDGTRNAVHGSDSAAAAARELRFFFPALAPPPPDAAALAAALAAGAAPAAAALRRAAVEAYMGERLEPVLAEALAELARGKPAAGSGDATAWLARWLLDHGPAQAHMLSHSERPAEALLNSAAPPARPSIGARAFPGPCGAAASGSMAVGAAVGADTGPQGWAHRCTAAPQLMSAAKQWPAHSAAL